MLTIKEFSKANLQRCTSPNGFAHELESWHPSQWTNALAGEAGEACNLTKKMLRHDLQLRGNVKIVDTDYESLRLRAMKELADVIIYADLAIQALGGNTEHILRRVFNAKSVEIDSSVKV
jgi:NTP pyrophosphatase (non-canonical NTP hydrolase)